MHRVLCCGGRDFNNREFVETCLDTLSSALGFFAVIQGGAKGADELCANWAKSRGFPVISVNANWDFYGKRAGYLRNGWMLNICQPTYCVAFPGGRGTQSMVTLIKSSDSQITVWSPIP